jgi:hypothetical protein
MATPACLEMKKQSLMRQLLACVVCMGVIGLPGLFGCGVDWTSVLESALASSSDNTTNATLSDLVGTWTGTVTVNSATQNYQFVVDSSGAFVAGDGTTGTVTITSSGKVGFSYSSGGYTVILHGTLNSAKTQITMTTSTWSGTSSGSATFAGTLTKSSSSTSSSSSSTDYTLADLVGTWTGSLVENGLSQTYEFTVDSSGAFTTGNGISGTVTILTGSTVIFAYSSGGYTGTIQGTINTDKTQITVTKRTWSGTGSGSVSLTGTLTKA